MTLGVLLLMLLWRGVCTLSAPSGLSISSINMRHILSWIPLQDHCNTTVLYSVQYQGEFERHWFNGSWLAASCCQLISLSRCELSADLGSDTDYSLRVRGHCGHVLSPWQQLTPPFNRKSTLLLKPVLKLDVLGDSLLVSVADVPPTCFVRVFLWRTGHKDQVQEQVVGSQQILFDSAPLLEGEEYCVRAQSELQSGERSSPPAVNCIHITGAEGWWQKPVTVVFVVLLSVGLLSTVLWSISHCKTQTCLTLFHKEALPHSLVDVSTPVQLLEPPLEHVHILGLPHALPSTVALL